MFSIFENLKTPGLEAEVKISAYFSQLSSTPISLASSLAYFGIIAGENVGRKSNLLSLSFLYGDEDDCFKVSVTAILWFLDGSEEMITVLLLALRVV